MGMTVMDCSALGVLIANHEPIELIDVRSKNEFAAMHIPGARSLPLGELVTPKIFRRRRLTTERVYVISENGHAQANLATGILRSAGRVNAIPVDGGMKDWVARGLPVRRQKNSIGVTEYINTGAAIPMMAACVALALHEIMVAALLAGIAGLLLLKENFLSRIGGRKSGGPEPSRAIKIRRVLDDAGFGDGETP